MRVITTNEKTRNSRPSRSAAQRRRSNQTEHKEKPSTQGGISKQTNERTNVKDEKEEQTKCSKRSVCVRLLLLDEAEICAQLAVEEEEEWEDPAVTEFEHRKQT